jgi:hypothetical protein
MNLYVFLLACLLIVSLVLLRAHLECWRADYHFVRPHHSLRVALVQPHEQGGNLLAQRDLQRTLAMAAGRTHRRWTAYEVLSYPLPKGFA